METLGDDLVLLSIRSNGVIGTADKLRFGLSGAELVRLTALRRSGIERGRIIILDQTPTGIALLDEALMSMAGGRRPPTAKAWVARRRGDLPRRYLDRLTDTGTIRAERRKNLGFIPVTRWTIVDAERLAAARARLDAIAYGSGAVSSEQTALAGLAGAIGLPSVIYPGFAGRDARKQVMSAGRGRGAAAPVAQPAADTADASDAATSAAVAAATDAATRAAVQASIDAATEAAVAAATEAAHHAASSGGHAGGHH